MEVSDRVAVMRAGQIEQFASPQEVYEHPASPFVFQFLGHYNVFSARGQAPRPRPDGAAAASEGENLAGLTLVRPHDVILSRDGSNRDAIPALVKHVGLAGPVVRVELERLGQGDSIEAELTLERGKVLGLKPGDTVFVTSRQAHSFEDYSI